MKRTRRWVASTAVVLLAFATAGSWADKKITRADLPPAVERALVEESKGGAIRGLSKEVERGKTYYEAELTVNNLKRDILIDESGTVVEVEEEVDLASLPVAVRDGLKKAAGAREIVKIESITKSGTLVAYEAVVTAGRRRAEVKVDPSGNRLRRE